MSEDTKIVPIEATFDGTSVIDGGDRANTARALVVVMQTDERGVSSPSYIARANVLLSELSSELIAFAGHGCHIAPEHAQTARVKSTQGFEASEGIPAFRIKRMTPAFHKEMRTPGFPEALTNLLGRVTLIPDASADGQFRGEHVVVVPSRDSSSSPIVEAKGTISLEQVVGSAEAAKSRPRARAGAHRRR